MGRGAQDDYWPFRFKNLIISTGWCMQIWIVVDGEEKKVGAIFPNSAYRPTEYYVTRQSAPGVTAFTGKTMEECYQFVLDGYKKKQKEKGRVA